MKKVLKTIAAIPVLAGLVAAPAIAADKLDLSGEMRTRAWFMSFDDKDNVSFMDHRLRMYGKFMVNDQVQVHFRTDLSEATWGGNDSTYGAGRQPKDGSMQVDRAFLQLNNDAMRLRAGLQYYGYSPSGVINTQDEGLLLTIKNEVAPTSLFWIIDGSNEFQNEIFEEDQIFGFLSTPTIGSANVQVFGSYWMADDESFAPAQDTNIYMLGASVQTDVGMAALTAEIDFFGGEINDTVDATGIQGWIAADFKIDDAFTVTPSFYYAKAAGDDEQQIQVIGNDFGGWDPLFAIGTGLDNEKIGLGRPFDWTGAGAGAMGVALTTKYMINEALALAAGINYIGVEDDDIIDDSLFGLAAGLNYKFMGNAEVRLQIEYHDYDNEIAGEDSVMGGLHLGVKF